MMLESPAVGGQKPNLKLYPSKLAYIQTAEAPIFACYNSHLEGMKKALESSDGPEFFTSYNRARRGMTQYYLLLSKMLRVDMLGDAFTGYEQCRTDPEGAIRYFQMHKNLLLLLQKAEQAYRSPFNEIARFEAHYNEMKLNSMMSVLQSSGIELYDLYSVHAVLENHRPEEGPRRPKGIIQRIKKAFTSATV